MSRRKPGLQGAPRVQSRSTVEEHPLAQREARDEQAILVPIERIQPDPNQPRRIFDQVSLAELANSIREHGILQPLVLQQNGTSYQIVVGERRYRAAQMAGIKDIPARIYSDIENVREIQLVENLQRQDLSLFEEAQALAELQEKLGASIRGLEEATGKSKSYIARRLKILEMPEDVQELLRQEPGMLSKAETLAKIADPKRRAAHIRTLLGHETRKESEPAQRGRPAQPLLFKTRRNGAFDLVVKYRPGQMDRKELISQLREVVEKLEAEAKVEKK